MKDGLTAGEKDKIINEVFDKEFLDILSDKGHTLDSLLSLNPKESAKKFVDLAMQIDYLMPKLESNGIDYFKNISSLLILLAKKEGLYDNRETTYRALEDLVKTKLISKVYDEEKKELVYFVKNKK